MATIRFRPATKADFEFIFDLHKQTLGPYVDLVWGWDDEVQRAYLERTLDLDSTEIIVVDGADVGRLNIEHRDGELFLGLIEITPDHQGRGIGAHIVQTLLDTAFADAKPVRLNVLRVNSRAYQLYRRLGFHEAPPEGVDPHIRMTLRAHPPE